MDITHGRNEEILKGGGGVVRIEQFVIRLTTLIFCRGAVFNTR